MHVLRRRGYYVILSKDNPPSQAQRRFKSNRKYRRLSWLQADVILLINVRDGCYLHIYVHWCPTWLT